MADIPLLAEHFLNKYSGEHQKPVQRLSAPALDLLMQYPWPGNVRELENIIERAVLVCDEDTILSVHLPGSLQRQEPGASSSSGLASQVEKLEKELITEALRQTRGNQSKAAKILDTSLRILGYKIKQYNIETRRFRAA
jgi:Nif-specific regulatory protein